MSKTLIIECDLCGKKLNEDEVTTAEVVMSGRHGSLDFCSDCAGPLLEKLGLSESFECPDCDRVFPKPWGLTVHRVKMHGFVTANAVTVNRINQKKGGITP